MKKFFLALLLLILLVVAAGVLSWTNRTSFAAHFLSKSMKVPVTLHSLDIRKNQAHIDSLSIGNPPHSKTPTSFTTQTMMIQATLKEIVGNPLIIEEIDMSNIQVNIEYYNEDGTDNNWARILALNPEIKEKKSRDYLIKTLILTNLTVTLNYANGKTKTYPTIPRMEFHNISSETGFPIDEIEKAIFDLVMKDIFRKLGLDRLLQTIEPLKSIPKSLPLFK
ncbi:MAG TPA: hypothetical protein VLE89_06220 [Chlamydiales bacterium]|nr:hypothetical protein [Chlamydiales bacterium]